MIIERLKKFQNKRVPKHILLKFVQFILIPSLNWGAFMDRDDTEGTYIEIDNRITEFCMQLFGNDRSIEENKNFLIEGHEADLQLLLPGQFFKMMQNVIKNKDDVNAGFEQYHNERK